MFLILLYEVFTQKVGISIEKEDEYLDFWGVVCFAFVGFSVLLNRMEVNGDNGNAYFDDF